jgi:hypothetical protein
MRAIASLGADQRRCVVSLTLRGIISLAERHRLDRELKAFGARVHHLDVDDSGLVDEPTADDLDAIDTVGFVRLAVERLRAKAHDPGDRDCQAARTALRMIYFDHLDHGA